MIKLLCPILCVITLILVSIILWRVEVCTCKKSNVQVGSPNDYTMCQLNCLSKTSDPQKYKECVECCNCEEFCNSAYPEGPNRNSCLEFCPDGCL